MSVARETPRASKPKVRVRRDRKPTGVFGGLKPATAPLEQGRQQAAAATQRARRKVEARTVVPYAPKIRNPTPAQRSEAGPAMARALHKQGISTQEQIDALPPEQRRRVQRAAGYQRTARRYRLAATAILQGHTAPTVRALADVGDQIERRDTVRPGPARPKIEAAGVNVDLGGVARDVRSRLRGNPVSAVVEGTHKIAEELGKHGGIAGRAGQEIVDLPANTVTSAYQVGKQLATGHPERAARMVADPIVETVKHPVKSFTEHPVSTVLVLRGVKGAAGHGAGRVMRTGVAGKTAKRAASTGRAAKVVPGARVAIERRYSGDILTKAGQVTAERARVRRARRKGRPVEPRASESDIRRRVDEDVQAAKNVTAGNQARTGRRAAEAVGLERRGPVARVKARRGNRPPRPTAAVNLAAQGITRTSAGDLRAYLAELESAARDLHGRELDANVRARKLIEKALERHDPEAVRRAAAAYAEVAADLERQVIDRGLVKPAAAEEARLAGAAVRRLGVSAEHRATARATARADVKAAKVQRREARAGVRQAGQAVTKAQTRAARLSGRQQVQRGSTAAARMQAAAGAPSRARGVLAYIDQALADESALSRGAAAERKATRQQAKASHRVTAAKGTLNVRRTTAQQATAAVKDAERRGRQLKRAPYATAAGRPVTAADVRAAIPPGDLEPVYVSHQAIPPRAAALPSAPPRVPVKEQRSGEAVRRGTLDIHPGKLVEQAVGTQQLIDAAAARERFIADYGYRPSRDADVLPFRTGKDAEHHARDLEAQTGLPWAPMRRQDGLFTLVPRTAAHHLAEHEAAVAKVPAVKVATTQWRRNVLAFSPRWLTGNTLEAALRAVVAGAGPTSYTRARRVLAAMPDDLRQQVKARTVGGGNYGTAGRIADTERVTGESLGRFAHALYQLRRAPGARQIADAYGAYTDFIFHTLNGRLESQFQTAMLGRALRDHPLMDDHVVGLSHRAVMDAAAGLRNTNAQVELGRQVDRMYGRYQKYSPGLRNAISTYTPFAAWTINAVNFLYHVLPADHPVLTGLIASSNQATEDWRKQHGLYLDILGQTSGQLPPWLQGSIPGQDASHLRISRYTPFGLLENESGSPVGGLPDLLLPQVSEIMKNLEGKDWSGQRLGGNQNGARDLIAAAASLIEGQVPLASQVAHVTGARLPNMRDTQQITPDAGTRAREQFDPFRYTPARKPKVRAAKGPGVTWGASGSGVVWSR